MNYQTLAVSLADGVANVVLNRPDKSNAMNRQMWDDIRDVFRKLDETPEARVVVLSGAGKHFNAGIDLAMLSQITDSRRRPRRASARSSCAASYWICRTSSPAWKPAASRCSRRSTAPVSAPASI